MNKTALRLPIEQRYFEDYEPGAVYECGSVSVKESEIISFARQFDPQPFHVDPEAAVHSMYGGLIASGWHTAGLMMRLFVANFLSPDTSMGSPGLDELRWLKPVRPGDILSLRVTLLESKRSRSKPDRGIIRTFIEVLNQHDEIVMSMKAWNFISCREG